MKSEACQSLIKNSQYITKLLYPIKQDKTILDLTFGMKAYA